MKTARLLPFVLLFAAAAYAWPLMGTWNGELNGKPITITLRSDGRHTEGRLAVTSVNAPADLQITNLQVSNQGRLLTFQVPNQSGGMKLVSSGPERLAFQLEMTSTNEALLHRLDDPHAPAIKMTRTGEPAR